MTIFLIIIAVGQILIFHHVGGANRGTETPAEQWGEGQRYQKDWQEWGTNSESDHLYHI